MFEVLAGVVGFALGVLVGAAGVDRIYHRATRASLIVRHLRPAVFEHVAWLESELADATRQLEARDPGATT